MAAKRPIVVEGNTPGKPDNKRPPPEGKSRKSLFHDENIPSKKFSSAREWSAEETSSLVQYICLFSEDAWRDKWPTTKDAGFWNACADSVNKTCKSSRTGLSALIKAMLYAQKKEERKRCDLIYDSLHWVLQSEM